jgi:predicted nuclease with TOPRIM domain
MVTLEQVKLLEAKVAKAIGYVEKVSGENAELQGKLESYQKRIDELEVLVQQFREDQGRIEDGILSALDRLNQFEDAIERSLDTKARDKKSAKEAAAKPVPPAKPVSAPPAEEILSGGDESSDPDIELKPDAAPGEELDIF